MKRGKKYRSFKPLSERDIQYIKARCCAEYGALWLHHFAQAVEHSTLVKFGFK